MILLAPSVSNKINHLREQLLQIIYNDNISSFEDLLERDKSHTIHQRNIQSLAMELFKVQENFSNNAMHDIFQTTKINCNLRSQSNFARNKNKLPETLLLKYGTWFH